MATAGMKVSAKELAEFGITRATFRKRRDFKKILRVPSAIVAYGVTFFRDAVGISEIEAAPFWRWISRFTSQG